MLCTIIVKLYIPQWKRLMKKKGRFHASFVVLNAMGRLQKKRRTSFMTGNRKKPILISCTCSQLRLGIGTPQDYCAFGEFKRVIFHRNHLFMVATLPPDEKKIDSIDLQGIGFFFLWKNSFKRNSAICRSIWQSSSLMGS